MGKNDNLAEKLIKENGPAADIDLLIEKIKQAIDHEKSRLRQMRWVTAGLWIGAIAALALDMPQSNRFLISNRPDMARIYLSIVASWLPILAVISTIFLFFRSRSFANTEISLRMNIVEAKMLKMEIEARNAK